MGEPYIYQLIALVILILLALFIFIIPERRKKKQSTVALRELKTGDRVFTKSGLRGTVEKVQRDTVIIKTEPAEIRLEVAKWGIARVDA